MFHMFSLKRPEFLGRYQQRSNVEAVFSSMKRLYPDYLRSKSFTAQKNELLLKVLVYNIACVIKAAYELGIELVFPILAQGRGGSTPTKQSGWRLI